MKQPNIIAHLQDVLFLYSSVILPDIGEFSKQTASANIKEYDNVIVPPKKTLHFNPNRKHNDFILVKHIAKKEQISEAQAQHHIDTYVSQLQEELNVGHTINLLEIGELSKTPQGNLLFIGNEEANYSFDTFGLPPVELPEIKADKGFEIPAKESVVGAGEGLHTTIEKKEIVEPLNKAKNDWIGAEEAADEYMTEKLNTSDGTIADILAAKAEKNAAKMPLDEPLPPEKKKKKAGFWLWLLPIMIFCLFIFLLLQLTSSDKQWWEHKPFSYFAKDKTETLANNNAANGNDKANANNANSAGNSGNNSSNTNATGGNNSGTITNTNKANQASNNAQNGNNSASNANNGSSTNGNTTQTNNNNSSNSSNASNASKTNNNTTKTTNNNATTSNTTPKASSAELNKIKINVPKANEYLATKSPKGYYVVIGAFKGDTNANKKINELKNEGFKAYSLPTKSGWNRVGIYNTDVNKAKNQLLASKKKHNKGAWLLHFK